MKLIPKIIILVACLAAIAMVIYPPMHTLHKYGTYSVGYTFIWKEYTVSAAQLSIQLVVLFVVAGALSFITNLPSVEKVKNGEDDEQEGDYK
jgi:4-hydroxybenzoate polyprenyltransferase